MLRRAVGGRVTDVERTAEPLSEFVRCAHLQRLAVPHDRFARHRVRRAGEAFLDGLAADDHGHGEHVAHEVLVHVVQDAQRVLPGIRFPCVRGVPFLPQELRGAQEDSRPQLPTHDVGPLVEDQREIAVAVDPLGHVLADDGFACRADGKRLGQLLASAVGHDGELRTESLDVVGLALEEAHRDQQREVRVLSSRGLDPLVDLGLHPLPHRVAVGPDDDGAACRAVLGQLRLGQDVLIPARKVVLLRSQHRHPARPY